MDEAILYISATDNGHEASTQAGAGARGDSNICIGIIDITVDNLAVTDTMDNTTDLGAMNGARQPTIVHYAAFNAMDNSTHSFSSDNRTAIIAMFHLAGGGGIGVDYRTPISITPHDGGSEIAIHHESLVVVADTRHLGGIHRDWGGDIAFADSTAVVEADACNVAAGCR